MIPRISDEDGVVIYADPPYLHSSRSGDNNGGYLHDFVESGGGLYDQDDHERLAGELLRFKRARVVVSYYDHPRLADLYPGWTRIDKSRQKVLQVANQRGANRKEAPEVLLMNGPSYTDEETTLFATEATKEIPDE